MDPSIPPRDLVVKDQQTAGGDDLEGEEGQLVDQSVHHAAYNPFCNVNNNRGLVFSFLFEKNKKWHCCLSQQGIIYLFAQTNNLVSLSKS